jgi:methylated-DNA-[protein]-cysteine S-methyltransferase
MADAANDWRGPGGRPWRLALATPVGTLLIEAAEHGLATVSWLDGPAPPEPPAARLPEVLVRARDELSAYFAGKLERFSVPLLPRGTRFQRMVWGFIADIPYGATLTYRELADLVGSAPRAVARACAANPLPLLIPCHRVVGRADRGGYSGGAGPATKDFLLGLEGAPA